LVVSVSVPVAGPTNVFSGLHVTADAEAVAIPATAKTAIKSSPNFLVMLCISTSPLPAKPALVERIAPPSSTKHEPPTPSTRSAINDTSLHDIRNLTLQHMPEVNRGQ
jgi:hypothetical protein